MGCSKTILAFVVSGFLGVTAVSGQDNEIRHAAARYDGLILKLGSPSFMERERALRELGAFGVDALPALKRAGKPADLETQCRIAELVRLAEEQVLTQQVLAPKEVHLKLTGASVDEAIAELAKRAGYPLQFQGDRVPLADKKITLDTGKTTFWQALDQLCDNAGLVERIDTTAIRPAAAPNFGKVNFGKRIVPANSQPPVATGPIVLTNRGQEKVLTSYAGAVKSQLRVSRDVAAKELILQLVVSIEPRLVNGTLVGRPIVDRVFDQERRKLSEAVATVDSNAANRVDAANLNGIRFAIDDGFAGQPASHRHVQVRIKEGDHVAKQLQELAGKLSLQVELTNETIARLDKVLEASGRSAAAANGGTLRVNSVRKLNNGDIEVQVSMVNLTANPFGNNIIVNGGNVIIRGNLNIQGGIVIGPNGVRVGGQPNAKNMPDLIDAKGQKFQVASASSDGTSIMNGTISTSATILYRPNPGQAGPNELVLFGSRAHTIAVPFRFENVPLP